MCRNISLRTSPGFQPARTAKRVQQRAEIGQHRLLPGADGNRSRVGGVFGEVVLQNLAERRSLGPAPKTNSASATTILPSMKMNITSAMTDLA